MSIRDLFPTFQAALEHCGQGYDDDLIARVVAYKTLQPSDPQESAPEQVVNAVLATAVATAAKDAGAPLRVLDFGGACGVHYLKVQPVISSPLRWAIVETPAMVARAMEVADGRFTAHGSIPGAAAALGSVDLVFTSGAIQCVPDPLGVLRALAALKAPYLALARFPTWLAGETVGIQDSRLSHNGIGPLPLGVEDSPVRYPVTFTPFEDVAAALVDYEMILKTASPSATYDVDGVPAPGASMIYRRRSAA